MFAMKLIVVFSHKKVLVDWAQTFSLTKILCVFIDASHISTNSDYSLCFPRNKNHLNKEVRLWLFFKFLFFSLLSYDFNKICKLFLLSLSNCSNKQKKNTKNYNNKMKCWTLSHHSLFAIWLNYISFDKMSSLHLQKSK